MTIEQSRTNLIEKSDIDSQITRVLLGYLKSKNNTIKFKNFQFLVDTIKEELMRHEKSFYQEILKQEVSGLNDVELRDFIFKNCKITLDKETQQIDGKQIDLDLVNPTPEPSEASPEELKDAKFWDPNL